MPGQQVRWDFDGFRDLFQGNNLNGPQLGRTRLFPRWFWFSMAIMVLGFAGIMTWIGASHSPLAEELKATPKPDYTEYPIYTTMAGFPPCLNLQLQKRQSMPLLSSGLVPSKTTSNPPTHTVHPDVVMLSQITAQKLLNLELSLSSITSNPSTEATPAHSVQEDKPSGHHVALPTTLLTSAIRYLDIKPGLALPEKLLRISPRASEEPKIPSTAAPAHSAAAPGPQPAPQHETPGTFRIVGDTGVPAMHAALLPNGHAVFIDKVEDYTHLTLENGRHAYSAEYDPTTGKLYPLAYKTNSFCAGGTFLANGDLLVVGGNGPLPDTDPTVGDGFKGIRYLKRSASDSSLTGQAFIEPGHKLDTPRWYPSVQRLEDGRVIVVAGSRNALDPLKAANNNPTYEVLSPEGISIRKSINMDILVRNQPYYMYPFLHLLPDSNIFTFAGKQAQIFDYVNNSIVRELPDLPGMSRTYPNTGGSVLHPLSSANDWKPVITICGGGAYQDITSPTDASCGTISPLDKDPQWEMEAMPEGRGMVEGHNLPDGTMVWLNGAKLGAEGFRLARDPALEALIYEPKKPLGKRFTTAGTSEIARMYHSVSFVNRNGTVTVAGSNPEEQPVLTADIDHPFATEFRQEEYIPPYLQGGKANRRPTEIRISTLNLHANGETFEVEFKAPEGTKRVQVLLRDAGFNTHALSMGARTIILDTQGFDVAAAGSGSMKIQATMPPKPAIAPPGPYEFVVVCDGVPSISQSVMVA